MSYCLKKDEPLASGIRRIAREQLEKALCEIKGLSHKGEGAAVHATRKHIKRTRALLRLVRRELGPEIFKGENQRLRDVARNFSGSRDARVQLQVLEKLRDGADLETGSCPQTTVALKREIADLAETFGDQQPRAATTLQQICDRLEGWPLESIGSDDLSCALKKTYRRGRKSFRCVASDPSADNFHSWRKRVKDLWYQAQVLQNLNQTILCEIAEGAKTLGHELGDLHDLAFFRERLEGSAQFPEDERALLLGLVCTRERELERVALDLGARFYAEKPGAFGRRLLAYARHWPERRTSA
ncbi:MAG TPA: CHAD domain-containing protein [Chthoniobacterales bacterium]